MSTVDGSVRRTTKVAVTGWVMLNAALLVVGTFITRASIAARVRRLDRNISAWFAKHRAERLDDVTELMSRSADTEFIVGLIIVISVCIAISRSWSVLWLVPLAMAIEITTFGIINTIVRRGRPDVPRLGSTPATSSFPSGHAAATIVCWLGAAVLLWWAGHLGWARCVGAVGVVLTGAVAFSRVYRGMHFTFDVAFGIAMGLAALWIATRAVHPGTTTAGELDVDVEDSRISVRGDTPRTHRAAHR
jgi:membrane-associated phospholipid phosphatase